MSVRQSWLRVRRVLLLEEIRMNEFKIVAINKENTNLGKGVKSMKRERDRLMTKIEVRQKYLQQVQEKKNMLLERQR